MKEFIGGLILLFLIQGAGGLINHLTSGVVGGIIDLVPGKKSSQPKKYEREITITLPALFFFCFPSDILF